MRYDDVEVGDELAPQRVRLTRADLVRYAGASGDYNPIHWSERVARTVGLPTVIAHGMLSLGRASSVVTAWVGDPGRIVELGARFTAPVLVPDDDEGAEVTVTGTVVDKGEEAGLVRIDLTASTGEAQVLGAAFAVVRLDR